MKIIKVILITLVAGLMLSGCEGDNDGITASVTDNTGCKSLKSDQAVETTPDTLSCIIYAFDNASKKLSVSHINAGFNCCPGKLSCRVDMSGDTLIIKESEARAGCNCNCLFDLNIEVKGLDCGEYILKIVEPYCGGQEKLIAVIDLVSTPSGSFCALRKNYPWGMP